MEPTKERIKRDALLSSYKWVDYDLCDSYKEGYIAGATCENDYAQQELQAYRDMIRELLPIAQWGYDLLVPFDKNGMGKDWPSTIQEAKKLIDTVTPT